MRGIRWLARVVDKVRSQAGQTCPRRQEEPGPWSRSEGLDSWSRGRWSWLLWLDDWTRVHVTERGWFIGGTYWPAGEPKPRTCTFCGGVHPDDAIALVERGWHVESTSKGYKRYLHPPGYREAMSQMLGCCSDEKALTDRAVDAFLESQPDKPDGARLERIRQRYESAVRRMPRSPVPPVKLYVQHFTDEQCRRFNQRIDEHVHRSQVAHNEK